MCRWGLVSKAALTLVAVLMLIGVVPGSAAGARQADVPPFDEVPLTDLDVSDDFWLQTTTIWVIEEVAAIGATGVFEEHPMVDRILAEVPLPDDGLLFETMIDYDTDNIVLMERLLQDGRELSPVILNVMGPLPRDVIVDVQEGQTGTVDPMPWLVAVTDLLLREGAAGTRDRSVGESEVYVIGHFFDLLDEGQLPTPDALYERLLEADAADVPSTTVVDTTVPVTEPPVEAAPAPVETTVAPTDVVADASTTPEVSTNSDAVPVASAAEPAAAADDPGGFGVLPFLVAGGVAAGLVVLALVLRRGGGTKDRRRSRPDDAGWLLEASRRMTAALDVDAVARIAVEEAASAIDTDGGVMWSVSNESVLAGDMALAEALVEGRHMSRVIETIQPATVELLVGDEELSVLAMPVASGGRVVGVLAVQRGADRPLGRDAVEQSQAFAPLVGSALAAAVAHSSAVTEADVDGLTGLKNRRRLDRDLAALPRGSVVGFAMVDVDHFKHFNDTNGHQAGDVALQTVGECLAANVRSADVVYRYGGEEFSVVLADTTEAEAIEVLERVRAAVESADIPGAEHQPGGRVTISVGLVVTGPSDPSAEHLAMTADEALYRAKRDGRNRVVVA